MFAFWAMLSLMAAMFSAPFIYQSVTKTGQMSNPPEIHSSTPRYVNPADRILPGASQALAQVHSIERQIPVEASAEVAPRAKASDCDKTQTAQPLTGKIETVQSVLTAAEKAAASTESVPVPYDRDDSGLAWTQDPKIVSKMAADGRNLGYSVRATPEAVVGFSFSNHGGNRILPPSYDVANGKLYARDFLFSFDGRAKQDSHLAITDQPAGADGEFWLSDAMESVIMHFPRKQVPTIRNEGQRNVVTLTTGEEFVVDAKTSEILSGALSEEPVDLNPVKKLRRFAGVQYHGKGIQIRANAIGSDPRVGTVATITTGSPDPSCKQGARCSTCSVPASRLWEQDEASGQKFRFATDEALDAKLKEWCGFGIPKL